MVKDELEREIEDKKTVRETLDSTRSALATLKESYDDYKKKKNEMEKENEEHKREMIALSEQLKKLEGVKNANQKLLGKMRESDEELSKLKDTYKTKEKVHNYTCTGYWDRFFYS